MGCECESLRYKSDLNWSETPFACMPSENVVAIVSGCKAYYFNQTGGPSGPFSYTQDPPGKQSLTFDSTECVFNFSDACDGSTKQFENHTGNLLSKEEASGNTCDFEYDNPFDTGPSAVTQTFEQDGRTVVDRYEYQYQQDEPNAGMLTSATWSRQTNPVSDLKRILYSYYGDDDPNGSVGDLKTVTTQLLRGTTWEDLETQYFRYYKAGDPKGFAHALKYNVKPTSFVQLKNDPDGADPFTADDAVVARYADNYYEYDSQQRAIKSVVAAGLRTYTYQYQQSANSNAPNNWKLRTETTRPDGAHEILYSNYLTQPLLHELVAGTDNWITTYLYDSGYRQIQEASPSAVVSYNDAIANLGIVLRSDAGLIRSTQYYASTNATETTPGGVKDYVSTTKIQRGTNPSSSPSSEFGPFLQSQTKYFARKLNAGLPTERVIYPIAEASEFRITTNDDPVSPNPTDKPTTSYLYEWFSGSLQYRQRTTIYPVVTTGQNGPGNPVSPDLSPRQTEIFDTYGNVIWLRDPRGFITYRSYYVATGALTQQIEDVDTSRMSGVPSGWSTPASGGLHLVTDYVSDAFGRVTQTLGPAHDADGQSVRTADWTVYLDLDHETRSARGYAYGPAPSYEFELVNPVSVNQTSADGLTTDSISAVRTSTQGRLTAADCFPQASWVRWSKSFSNVHDQQTSSRTYYCIPPCGAGELGVNYADTVYGYDVMGRQNRIVSPSGTITRTVFDVRGLTQSTWIGTNDAGATDAQPGPGTVPVVTANNMLPVSANEYDGGLDGGDGNLTKSTAYVDEFSANNRVTEYVYDWRNRRKAIDGELSLYQETNYDNLGHEIQIDLKDGNPMAVLLGRTKNYFDNRGRLYRTERFAVDPTNGGISDTVKLSADSWYDAVGNTVKQVAVGAKDGRAFTKNAYDGVNRRVATYVGIYTGSGSESYAEAITVTGSNRIFAQVISAYDGAANLIQTTDYRRYDNETQNGVLYPPFDPDSSHAKARTTYLAQWYDGSGRQIGSADFGTNAGQPFERPEIVPDRSDNVLVSTSDYDAAGNAFRTIDSDGRESRRVYDAAGRSVLSVANYVANSGSALNCSNGKANLCCASIPQSTADGITDFTPGNEQNVVVR